MGLLDRQAIFDAADIAKEKVAVPEWGGEVMVYGLTAGEKDAYEDGMINTSKKSKVTLMGATARLCAMCIRDEKGNRIFTDADVAALGKKSSAAMERISKVAQKLSGMGKDDIEEIVKNSEAIQGDVSS